MQIMHIIKMTICYVNKLESGRVRVNTEYRQNVLLLILQKCNQFHQKAWHEKSTGVSIITDSCSYVQNFCKQMFVSSVTVLYYYFNSNKTKVSVSVYETEELSRSDSINRPRHCDDESLLTRVRLRLFLL